MQTGNAIQKGGEVMDITIITGSTPEELMGLLGKKTRQPGALKAA
jgi:hypothetical protein